MITVLSAILTFVEIVISGILGGLIGSLTGLGGGTVIVPILSLFMGVPLYFAAGAGLISSIATSAGSASAYTRDRIANIKVGIGLEVATTLGVILGASLAVYVYTKGLEGIIYVVFGLVLLFSLIPTIRRGKYELPQELKKDRSTGIFQLVGSYFDSKMKKEIKYSGIRWWFGEIVVFISGTLSGLLGIGGGALNVLAMDGIMNLPMKVATTTSNFMVGITAATGTSIYWYEGYIQFFIVASTAIGVLIGAFLGAKILVRISNKNIRWIFFSILSFLGAQMVLKGLNAESVLLLNDIIRLAISGVFAFVLIFSIYIVSRRKEAVARPS